MKYYSRYLKVHLEGDLLAWEGDDSAFYGKVSENDEKLRKV